MYESSPRSREVANALFQIDRLTEEQVRSVLRHIAIDDAVLNEAQCSHVACVISGTLNKAPREGVNASLTCGTSLDAACHWERSFASHPGHVSATFRKDSVNKGAKADNSTKQVVLFKPEDPAPSPGNVTSNDTKPSVGGPSEPQGLTIVNQGQLTLHYHSYNTVTSSSPRSITSTGKHALERGADEEYSEALASLLDCNLSAPSHSTIPGPSKRRCLEEPELETTQVDAEIPEAEADMVKAGAHGKQYGTEQQGQVKQEEDQPVKQSTNKTRLCKKCGQTFNPKKNNSEKKRCHFHPGTLETHPAGLKRISTGGFPKKPLYEVWSCCQLGANAAGCAVERHEEDAE